MEDQTKFRRRGDIVTPQQMNVDVAIRAGRTTPSLQIGFLALSDAVLRGAPDMLLAYSSLHALLVARLPADDTVFLGSYVECVSIVFCAVRYY